MDKSYDKSLQSVVNDLQKDDTVDDASKQYFVNEANSLLAQHSTQLTINQQLYNNLNQSDSNMKYEDFERQIKLHIERLKIYNELKDSGMNIISLIAGNKNIDIATVVKDINVNVNDDE